MSGVKVRRKRKEEEAMFGVVYSVANVRSYKEFETVRQEN